MHKQFFGKTFHAFDECFGRHEYVLNKVPLCRLEELAEYILNGICRWFFSSFNRLKYVVSR